MEQQQHLQKARKALKIASTLKEHGHTVYYAGGCVRDEVMGQTPVDYDIATGAVPDEVENLFAKTVAVGKQYGVILVVDGDDSFEVATFRRDKGYQDGRHPEGVAFTSAEEDAKRRDFTVNGLFYDPFEKKVIDFVGGREDIKARRIRAIGEPAERFEEDKLRILRAVRFASSLDFEIEAETWKAVCASASEIHAVSPERIRDELIKIFTRPGAARGMTLLSDSGLMREILPEIEAMKGVEQQPDYHPEGDVFVHTRMLLEQLENPSLTLAFAALFHDVAKPITYAIRKGKITFYEHAPEGAKMTEKIMKRLRFSNDQIRDVCACVDGHMRFADVQRMRSGKLKQFVTRQTFETEMELHRIDCTASHGMLDNYQFLKGKIKEYEKEDLKPKPLINGNDLQTLGLKPGPAMKPILEEMFDLQLEGQFADKAAALAWARTKIAELS